MFKAFILLYLKLNLGIIAVSQVSILAKFIDVTSVHHVVFIAFVQLVRVHALLLFNMVLPVR